MELFFENMNTIGLYLAVYSISYSINIPGEIKLFKSFPNPFASVHQTIFRFC